MLPTTQDSIWSDFQQKCLENISSASLRHWIEPAHIVEFDEEHITLSLPADYIIDHWKMKLEPVLKEVCYNYTGKEIEVSYLLSSTPQVQQEVAKVKNSSINGDYTFQNFVCGKNNRMAFTAANAVVERPGDLYNPLFLYGPSGLGKTHLMHAIANELLAKNPNANIKLIPSETFINEFTKIASQSNNTVALSNFREKYRNVDALFIDDIQFFIDKTKTQDEFFYTFEELYNSKKQIVLTSDRSIKELDKFDERLSSRCGMGTRANIESPDFETRIKILHKKSLDLGLNLEDSALHYIASKYDRNVRDLESALKSIMLYLHSELQMDNYNEIINLAMVKAALQHEVGSPQIIPLMESIPDNEINYQQIQELVADYYHISLEELLGKGRAKKYSQPRQIAMYLIRKELQLPFDKIAVIFNRKDHTTIMYSIEKIEKNMKQDEALAEDISTLEQQLSTSVIHNIVDN
ncbi:chromosomal replication initiator protein DnaA [Catellicoccus marimammalium]|uniref:Chromosomal replication initiator protein DnaA n=1 Tax=Catellicoccus marimammalium M35/04/3 TaxID=1234409 RepID=K8ZKS3_9ENTE|nr:chromosomal replication initiator protein DnaA [Catellicoccus marimammalium]EKU27178.1 Chromosomal replication initiator protein DnaA [Catellicoccus marimammalium M35/04/3]